MGCRRPHVRRYGCSDQPHYLQLHHQRDIAQGCTPPTTTDPVQPAGSHPTTLLPKHRLESLVASVRGWVEGAREKDDPTAGGCTAGRNADRGRPPKLQLQRPVRSYCPRLWPNWYQARPQCLEHRPVEYGSYDSWSEWVTGSVGGWASKRIRCSGNGFFTDETTTAGTESVPSPSGMVPLRNVQV
jgi:hypothetical protein